MDYRQIQFLQAVVGTDGTAALTKATSRSQDLAWAILPRVVMGWLDIVSRGDYRDAVPGNQDVNLNLAKSESLFTGSVNIGSELYSFRDVSLEHVAGSVAVALGASAEQAPEFRHPAFAKLGKSIDLLVKSRTLRKMQEKQQAGGAKGSLPGTAAAPRPPQLATAPILTAPKIGASTPGAVGTGMGTKSSSPAGVTSTTGKPVKPKPITLPGMKPKAPTPAAKPGLKVTKAEAQAPCPACGDLQFAGAKYVGCICFKALAKSVTTTATPDGYRLDFGADWDRDAVTTLIENLKE